MTLSPPQISILTGVFLTVFFSLMLVRREGAHRLLKAFPRSVWPARIFTAAALVWFAFNLWKVDLGMFSVLKNLLFLLVPAGVYLITVYLRDLLAVRGLCALILLSAQLVFIAVRWHGSPAHYAVAVFMYLLIILCMFLVVYPHLWIRYLERGVQAPAKWKTFCLSGTGIGVILILCGAVSF